MFWSWQDLRQYSRIDDEMHDGVLESGVVTEARDTREGVWKELARLFKGRKNGPEESDDEGLLTLLPLRWIPFGSRNIFHKVDLQPLADADVGRESWMSFEAILEKYWTDGVGNDQWKRTGSHFALWRRPELNIAGAAFRSPLVKERVRPIVLTPEFPEIIIPIHQPCAQLHILGQVSFPLGYPLIGRAKEPVAVYTFQYANGEIQSMPIRNGIEVAQSNCIDRATRIVPIATATQPAFEYIKDKAREEYQILLWSIPTKPGALVNMRCQLNSRQPALAIFAITVEQMRS
jgi:hypothetical protein